MNLTIRCAVVFFIVALASRAEEPKEAYARAQKLRELTANKLTHQVVEPHWLPGGTLMWFRSTTGRDSHEFVLVNAEKGERALAFDHEKLAAALNDAGLKNQRASKLNIEIAAYRPAEKSLDFRCEGKGFQCDLNSYAFKEIKLDSPVASGGFPPGRAPTRSTSGSVDTSLTFVNATKGEVDLFWLDEQGQRRSYGKLAPGREHEQHTFAGHVWVAVARDGSTAGTFQASEAPSRVEIGGAPVSNAAADPRSRRRDVPRQAQTPNAKSPDGQFTVIAADNNLALKKRDSEQAIPLTKDGTADEFYSDKIYWSPDSKHFVGLKTKKAQQHKVTLVESSPKDQVQPRVKEIDYLKPGDKISQDRPLLFDALAAKQIPVDDALFQNPWSINEMRWMPDSSRFTFLYNQRGHQALRIVSVDASTGAARAIIDETTQTFIDYSSKYFCRYLDATKEIIWMSERDGWNHLYLIDAETGKVKNQITKGEWLVRNVDRVDVEKRQIWFRAGGIHPGQDPYFIHYARVNFDGSGFTKLTDGPGTHTITYSPDSKYFIDTYSAIDLPPVNELRRTDDGKLVATLDKAEMSALQRTGWRAPEPFVAKGRDNATDIYGMILRPTNFDANKKYPVIEHIYAGPQGAFVPKHFSAYSNLQKLAELGFIVVQIDGMGTNWRSRAFHDVCWKNLGDSGFPDRILWLKAAAQKYPQLDLSRVGIYGGSAGGQSALRALLGFGDFYKVAVADSGCHDNRMDKIWWNEQWMGWPIGPHYAEQSNVTQAHKLTGKLLLLAGEMDTNVDPASTMQVANALIKAGKDFEYLMVPGAGHGVLSIPAVWKKAEAFFYRHLIGGELF